MGMTDIPANRMTSKQHTERQRQKDRKGDEERLTQIRKEQRRTRG